MPSVDVGGIKESNSTNMFFIDNYEIFTYIFDLPKTLSNTVFEILKTLDLNITSVQSCPIEPFSVFLMQLSEHGLVFGRDPAKTSEIFQIIGL